MAQEKNKAPIFEEMTEYLKEAEYIFPFKQIFHDLGTFQPRNPVIFLYESLYLKRKCQNSLKILEIYYILTHLKECLVFNPIEIHSKLTEFFISKGNMDEFSKANIKKLYKLLLYGFPEKLQFIIIEEMRNSPIS